MYRKVELGNLINKSMRQEVDQDIELDTMDDISGEENPYRELIVNNAGKIKITLSQMEQWSILSNVINYMQYDKNPKNFHTMSAKSVNKVKDKIKSKKDERERSVSEVDFINTSDRLKEEYLDRYIGVKSEILSTTRFDENSDLSTTSLGKASINKDSKITTEEKLPISEQGYTTGILLDGTKCQILLCTRASNSFMSKSLHLLSKFASKLRGSK